MTGWFLFLGAVMGVALLLGRAAKKYAGDKFIVADEALVCATKKQIAMGLLGALFCGATLGSLDTLQEIAKSFPSQIFPGQSQMLWLSFLALAPLTCLTGIPGAAGVVAAGKILEVQKIGKHKWAIAIVSVALVMIALRAPLSFSTLNVVVSAAVTAGIIGRLEKRRALSLATAKV